MAWFSIRLKVIIISRYDRLMGARCVVLPNRRDAANAFMNPHFSTRWNVIIAQRGARKRMRAAWRKSSSQPISPFSHNIIMRHAQPFGDSPQDKCYHLPWYYMTVFIIITRYQFPLTLRLPDAQWLGDGAITQGVHLNFAHHFWKMVARRCRSACAQSSTGRNLIPFEQRLVNHWIRTQFVKPDFILAF